MRVKFCPKCKNTDLKMIAGGITGIYKCKKCGFQSAIFPEIEIDGEKKKIKKENKKK